MRPQLQSTRHYMVKYYVKIFHVRLGCENIIMHSISWRGGRKQKRLKFLVVKQDIYQNIYF